MLTPGQFNVTGSGAFTYTVPITAPPGTGGMAPALSLGYSSQSGDGPLGLGWVLSGLPSIGRCPRTQSQDGVHGGVNYDANDRYCLDGQRLVLISGTYGAANSQYRTEVESFSKIIAYGTAGNGPSYFKVWTKAGQVMEFGNTTDSQVLAVGKTTARAWGVNKITDTKGNYLTVVYNSATGTDRTTNGEAYPIEIDYTGNASSVPVLSPYNKVTFTYATRADVVPVYQAGSVQKTTVLLSDIKTYSGASVVSDYKLAYTAAGSNASHDELTSVTQCDGTTPTPVCLKPTTFGWQGSRQYLTMTTTSLGSTIGASITPAQYNADGLTDYVSNGAGANCHLFFGTQTGFTAGSLTATYTTWEFDSDHNKWIQYVYSGSLCGNPIEFSLFSLRRPSDFNGDGFTDAMLNQKAVGHPATADVLLNTKLGALNEVNILSSPPYREYADFDGDGRTDVLIGGVTQFSNGDGTFGGTGRTGISLDISSLSLGDFDGDGCTDGLEQDTTNTIEFSCAPAVATYAFPGWTNAETVLGDFNGDGKTDVLVAYAASAGTLYLSTGTALVAQAFAVPSDWGKYAIYTGDWNGDGKTDIALIAPGTTGAYGVGTTHKIFLSTGIGFVQATDATPAHNPVTISNSVSTDYQTKAIVADWNNDGASDLWLQRNSADGEYVFSYTPELMTTVDNGLGIKTTVSYDRINKNGTFYAKGASAAYPIQDADAPLYVVSRIDSSNGLGACVPPSTTNCYSSSYSYVAAQVDLSGRGFSGFQQVLVTDLQTNIVQTTLYRLDFPFTGLVASQTKNLGSVTLNSTSNVYEEVSLGNGLDTVHRWFVGLHQAIVSGNDYDGTTTYAMPTQTTNYVYDCDTGSPSICSGTSPTGFGNATQITSAETYTSDNATKITTNTFDNDATNWFLGRLRTANVQSTVNSMPVLTRHTSYTYDPASGLLTSEIIESGAADPTLTHETDYGYDYFGNKATATNKGCVWISPTQCTIDAVGNPTSVRVTTTAFAQTTYHGSFPTTVTNPKSQSETWAYDLRFGQPTSHSGPNGLSAAWAYDTFGRKTLETRSDGNKTAISYTYCTGLPSSEACPTGAQFDVIVTPQDSAGAQNGPITITYYDGLSRAISTDVEGFDGPGTSCTLAAPCWVRSATQYDPDGRIAQTSRPYFLSGGTAKWTVNLYDGLSRIKQTTFPNSSKVTFLFHGLTSIATNDKSQATTTVRNAQGQIASVIDANSKTTSYTYDAFGNQLTVTDPATPIHNVKTDTYDLRGRKIASAAPDMGSWTYVYDGFGELYKQTDAKAQVTTLIYDALGRILTRTEVGLTSTWNYDTATGKGIGKLATATTGSNYTRSLSYDTLGRPLTTQLTVDGTASTYTSGYDSNGRVSSVTYPSGLVLKYIYTPTGYLCRVADNAGTPTCIASGGSQVFWTANARDAEMHLTQAIAGNGIITSRSFDPNTGLIQSITAGPTGSPLSVADFVYGFDTLGNLSSRQDVIENYTERFCYDTLNRLTNYAVDGTGGTCTSAGTKTVGYDALGNITSKTDVGTYNYSGIGAGPHAVTSITGTVNGLTNPVYTYDANGNQLCEYASSGGNCTTNAARLITWTSFNMASQITQSTTVINFTYDTEHARIKQIAGSNTTYYLNDPSSGAMSEKLLSGTTTIWHDYIQADGKIVVQRTAVAGGSTSFNYFVLDHLGSVAVIADSVGTVITGGRLSYDAWGRRRNADGTDAPSCVATSTVTSRGFTNQEEMDGICAVNLNARIYDPTIGKFLSADPVVGTPFNLQQLNRYSYVVNNPLSLIDPSGMCFLGCFWQSPIFAVVVAVAILVVAPYLEYGSWALYSAAISSGELEAVGFAALNGAIAGGVSSGLSGGNVLQGILYGGISGALFAGVGAPLGQTLGKVLAQPIIGNILAQGLVGGLNSVIQGGNFGSGFLVAGVGSLAGPLVGNSSSITPQGLAVSAVLGGAASVLGGGKFANGAITGAFAYAVSTWAEYEEVTASRGDGGVGNGVGQRYPLDNPGATFSTREAAATQIEGIMNPISIANNTEYDWLYYRDSGSGMYGYSDPYNTGAHGGAGLQVPFTINGAPSPTSYMLFGMGHTHADYADQWGHPTSKMNDYWHSDRFSTGQNSDMSFMRSGGPKGTWNFFTVGTPSGNVLEWTPEGGVQPLPN